MLAILFVGTARGLWVGACKNKTDFGVLPVRGKYKIIIKYCQIYG